MGDFCSMLMRNMRLQTLRQVDLNLFVTFAVIAEEKSITAAAAKLHLSQPAVSRALKRARLMFQDDLLIRSPNGFELTLRGRKLLDELNQLLLSIASPCATKQYEARVRNLPGRFVMATWDRRYA